MRARESKKQRGIEKSRIFFRSFLSLCLLASGLFVGCVRVAGIAGYSKINSEGETTTKQVSLDTQRLVDPDKAPGSVS